MASKAETYYPPYEGSEPYIHLCFSHRDERKVRPLLRRLLLRGCRVWYSAEQTRDRSAQLSQNERMLGAGLTVLYLTASAREDTYLKNRLLVCQKAKQPILVLNTDGGDSGLSLGLTGDASAIIPGSNPADAADAVLHGRGFSQAFLGEPQPIFDRIWLRRVSVLLLLFTVLLGGGMGLYRYLHPPILPPPAEAVTPEPEPTDQVLIADGSLQEAARAAIGGGLITPEALEGIESLSLSRLPSHPEDLSVFPNLSTLILSQEAAKAAPELPDLYERYTLIVAGGEGQ